MPPKNKRRATNPSSRRTTAQPAESNSEMREPSLGEPRRSLRIEHQEPPQQADASSRRVTTPMQETETMRPPARVRTPILQAARPIIQRGITQDTNLMSLLNSYCDNLIEDSEKLEEWLAGPGPSDPGRKRKRESAELEAEEDRPAKDRRLEEDVERDRQIENASNSASNVGNTPQYDAYRPHEQQALNEDPNARHYSIAYPEWRRSGRLSEKLQQNGMFEFHPSARMTNENLGYWHEILQSLDIPRTADGRQDVRPKNIYDYIHLSWDPYIHNLQSRDPSRLVDRMMDAIAPPMETLRSLSSQRTHLMLLVEDNLEWVQSLAGFPLRPVRSVGFRYDAFSTAEIHKLTTLDYEEDHMGFTASGDILFPFMTYNFNSVDIGIADVEGAHSMLVAVKYLVSLYRRAESMDRIFGKILGFSVSFDKREVRVWGYFPFKDGSTDDVGIRRKLMLQVYVYAPLTMRGIMIDARKNVEDVWLFLESVYERWAELHLNDIHWAIQHIRTGHGIS